jgi:hypothetical protein
MRTTSRIGGLSIGVFSTLLLSFLIFRGAVYAQDPKEVAIEPAVAERLLTSFVRENKSDSVTATIIRVIDKSIPVGPSCSSSSSGTISATTDEDGKVRGTTDSDTVTTCSQKYDHYQRMTVVLNDSLNPDAFYLLETECAQSQFAMIGIFPAKFHDPCLMPAERTTGPVVIKAGKHGTFYVEVYLTPPPRKLGDKPKGEAYKFAVLRMTRQIVEHK